MTSPARAEQRRVVDDHRGLDELREEVVGEVAISPDTVASVSFRPSIE
jgi:hypothetical protein